MVTVTVLAFGVALAVVTVLAETAAALAAA